MRALIFGCGYLGRKVASSLIVDGHEVFALTRSTQNADSLHQMGIVPLVGDICEPQSLVALPVVDVIMSAVGFDRSSGRTQEEVTCGGTRNILESTKGRYRQFIHISSTSVYGQSEGEWVDEDSECVPVQPGGRLNLIAERLVLDHASVRSDRCANILRLAGIYGPNRLLSRVEALRANEALAGRGDSWLNLIHVNDAVTAVRSCMARGEPGVTYNVVDDQPIQRREYFELLARLVGAPSPRFDPNVTAARGSGGLNKRCSNRRLRERLNWTPVFSSIATGLPHAVGASP